MNGSYSQEAVTDIQADNVQVGNITQISNQYKPEFLKLENLERKFQDENFVKPSDQFVSEAIKTLQKQRLLILAGGHDIDKIILSKYCACYFSNQFDDDKKPSVKEWQRSSDPQSIEPELSKQEKPTVYLFTQVSRQNFNSDLSRIHQAAKKNHYLIITTDAPRENWNIPEEQECWKDLDYYELYSSESLMIALENELKVETTLQSLQGDENLKNNIVNELKTPDKIVRVVSLLIHDHELKKEQSLKTAIDNAINTVKNYQQNLRDWYDFILDDREKLLALGLNLFEGLFVNQFFAALEEVVENVWQKRDPFLRALDYCDLLNVRHFFKFGIIGIDSNEQDKIESRVSKQRLILFEIAWKCHGRQMVAALPTINRLIQHSVDNINANKELYGTRTRRKQLQQVLGEAVGDIGWISPTAIQENLRELAENEQINVRKVAAQAIARWRNRDYYGHHKERFEKRHYELFDILNQWQDQASIQSSSQTQTQTNNEKRYQKQDYLRSSVALAVASAAIYDPNDALHQALCDLLKRLSDEQNHRDKNNPARLSFCFHTLPRVVQRHIVQLRDFLRNITQYSDFIHAISDSLALAYQYRPKDVLDTLDLWKQGQHNEQLLITIALTYGKIECDENIYPFTASQAFGQLQNLLIEEESPSVRLALIIAMGLKLQQNFEEIAPQFQQVISEMTQYEHERQRIVEILTFINFQQKNSLSNNIDRVETAMGDWVKDESYSIAQEMAIRALINFILVSDEEVKRLKDKIFLQFSHPETSCIVSQKPPYGIRFDKIIPWIVTRNNESYKTAIRHLLHEAWKRYKNSKDAMNSVLSNWETRKDDKKIVNISRLLRQGFWWLKHLDILATAGVALIIAVIIIPFMMPLSPDEPERENPKIPYVGDNQEPQTPSTEQEHFTPEPTPPALPPIIPKAKAMIDSAPNLLIAKTADVVDIDSYNFYRGKLTIKFTENAMVDDRLGIRTTGWMNIKGEYDRKKEIVYKVFHHNKVIGYFKDDKTLPLEIALTVDATTTETKALVRSLAYQNTSKTPQLGDRKIELQLTDGDGGISNAFSKTISVVTENEAPVINIPDEIKRQTIRETQKLSLSGISFTDVESQELTVTLRVRNGKLTVKQNVPKGLKSKNIRPAQQVILKGDIEQINTTLADISAITYQSYLDFSGEDVLQIAVSDTGKKMTSDDGLAWPPGAIDSKKTTKTIKITVIPAIILTVPSVQTLNEDSSLTISGINIEAPDSKNATVTLEVSNGTLTIKDDVANGVNRRRIQGNKTAKVTLTGTIEQLNTTLKDLTAITYQGHQNFNGIDTLKITGNDSNKFAHKVIKIQINAINDGPEISDVIRDVIPPPKTEAVVPPKPTYGIVITKRTALNIRARMSKMARAIDKAEKGERLLILEQKGTWYKVKLSNGTVGYASSQYIKIPNRAISPTSQRTLGRRVTNRADARYNKLAFPSHGKWWELVCQMMKEVYNEEVIKNKKPDINKIWRKVFYGTVDVIYQDQKKERDGWSRNKIEKKLSQCKF